MQPLIALFIVLSFSSFYVVKCVVPALYVFGDSLVDSGNNNWLPVLPFAKANYKPYGIDFPTNVSTGRVTNGKNVPDFFADFLRLPYPRRVKQPYVPGISPSLTGYNYASAGCGILPETGPQNCLDLPEQVRLFNVTKETVLRPRLGNQAALDHHLANSIFFIWVGNNDYLLNYFSASTNTSQDYTPEQFADLLIQQLSLKIELLHTMGARKIVVFEGPPFGCLPFYYAQNGSCVETKNDNAKLFNTKLYEMVKRLYSELQGAYFSVGRVYDLTYDAIINPSKYRLTNVTSPCCELAKLGGQTLVQCKVGGNKCANREEYLFWDNAHPTQAAYSIIGGQCITNSEVCFPFTIEGLLEATIIIPPSLLSVA